jgi:hypothetical protein
MDNLQKLLTEAYDQMVNQSNQDNALDNVGKIEFIRINASKAAEDIKMLRTLIGNGYDRTSIDLRNLCVSVQMKIDNILKISTRTPVDEAFGNSDDEGLTDKQQEESDIKSAEQIFGNHKGLNADWSVPAFHLSGNFPYGMWLVDSVDINGEWEIINRQEKPASIGYAESGEYQDTEVASGKFEEMLNKAQELYQK